MKVFVTLDYYDGTRSKVRRVSIDSGIDIKSIMFAMMESGVAGVTITKDCNIMDVVDHHLRQGDKEGSCEK